MRPLVWSTIKRQRVAVAAVGALAAALLTTVGAAGAPAAPPPGKQIAALKRQVTGLKAQVKSLKAENARLRAQVAALSPEAISRQLAQTKAALDKYQSVDQAKADGYAQASPCEAIAADPHGESSHAGGMGFHFVSQAAMADGKLDPAKPEILNYAPGPNGLQLVAAEYFKPDADQNLATDDDRPTLFGRAFDGPMAGHAPPMPRHYDLHVWLWKRNPSGMFAPWNPDVRCG
jgi:hypothetical protein